MKRLFMLLSTIALLLSFSSCKQDNPIEEDVRKEVKITASFKSLSNSAQVTTRASDSSWEANDEIGLFMVEAGSTLVQPPLAENVKYTRDDSGNFTNSSEDKLYYPFNEKRVDFISYYPYRDSLSKLIYKIDVSTQTDLSAIDLLYSNNAKGANSKSESVNLEFSHQLVKVILNINEGDTEKGLDNFTAKITNVNRKASFDLATGDISNENDVGDVSFNIDLGNKKAEAILLPSSDLSNNELVVTIDGTSYSYALAKLTSSKLFEGAKIYEYNLNLRAGKGPEFARFTAEIINWDATSGIKEITADEVPTTGGDTPEPSDGDTPGGESGDTGDEGSGGDPSIPTEGDGTEGNPYNIAQAKGLTTGTDIWVKGYIVGVYKNNELKDFTVNISGISESTAMFFALADLSTEESYMNTFPVKIHGDTGYENVRTKLGLKSNPENLGKDVILMGSISTANIKNPYALRYIKKAYIGDVKYE